MKFLSITFLFVFAFGFSQNNVEVNLVNSYPFKAEQLIGADNFGTLYFTSKNHTFHKQERETLTYSNVQFGQITTANTFNSLKINLFYKDFNTAIILDNRLAEIFKIDFNATQNYKNVSFISTGFDNTLWIFNEDLQQLELFDYKTNTIRVSTLPIQSEVIDLKSNYNYCWLLTKEYLYVYNYFGSLISKIENSGFTSMTMNNETVVLKKENSLFTLSKDNSDMKPFFSSELLINQFLVTNETLYIYDGKILYQYQLKTN